MPRPLVLLPALAGAAASAGVGCARAELIPPPRVVCAGDTTALRWNARGATSLAMTVVPGAASDSLGRADTVRLRLSARRFGRTAVSAPTEVVVVAGRLARAVGGRTARLGDDSVVATFTVADGEAPAYLRVATVAAAALPAGAAADGAAQPAGRAIAVAHAGRDAVLGADGAPSAAFGGLPVAGTWTLRAALRPGEVMGDAQHPPPRLLAAAVTATCGAGGR